MEISVNFLQENSPFPSCSDSDLKPVFGTKPLKRFKWKLIPISAFVHDHYIWK